MGKLICLCSLVEENEIVEALKKGARTTEDIQSHTGAGRSCGRCLPEIDELVELYNKKHPESLQKKLDLKF